MKKYQVKIYEVYATILDVAANTEEEAKQEANRQLSNGITPERKPIPSGQYDYTLEMDEWKVWEV